MRPEIDEVFARFPAPERAGLLILRRLIFEVAEADPEIGPIEEALRWGQPAYLTRETGAGSTLRLGLPRIGGFALFVHCRTSLIADFRPVAPPDLRFEGNRAVLFSDAAQIDLSALGVLIRSALRWHLPAERARRARF